MRLHGRPSPQPRIIAALHFHPLEQAWSRPNLQSMQGQSDYFLAAERAEARSSAVGRRGAAGKMGAEQSTLDTFEPSRKASAEEAAGDAALPPSGEIDRTDNNGWTMAMHAAESNNAALLRRLLQAGCDSTVESARTWGMFEAGSAALQIAELLQSRLGVDRAEVIEMLRADLDTAAAQARLRERQAQAQKDAATDEQDSERRRLAEAEARRKVAAARERKAAAELRLSNAQEAAEAEERRLRALASADSDADSERGRLIAATEAAQRKALAEQERVQQAEQRAAYARSSAPPPIAQSDAVAGGGNPSAADIAEMINNQMVMALDQAAIGLLGGGEAAVKTVSAARQEAETEAGKRLGASLSGVFASKLGEIGAFFRLADVNGDGVLSVEEFQEALQDERVGIRLSATEMGQVMLFADKDQSGTIDIEEFLSAFVTS